MRKMFYAKSTNGFYDSAIHGDQVPEDAIEISPETYQAMIDGQAGGMKISGDDAGNPILVDRPDTDIQPKPHLQLLVTQQQEMIEQLVVRIAALENK